MTRASLAVFVFLVMGLLAQGQPSAQATKRIILKDGSYQIVTKYELQGDRVHYYSAERGEWEDVPSSLIDWDATNKFERDRAEGKKSAEDIALDKELEAEREGEEAKSPHVAPGLRLPEEGGVYALDTYMNEPQLLPLSQNSGEINKQLGRNVLRAAVNPVAGSKQTIELAGPRAKIQIHAALPAIYVNLEPVEDDSASNKTGTELPWNRFQIVRAQVKGDKRIVGAIRTAVYGKVKQQQDTVPADLEQIAEGWVKVTPKAQLPPGEYALAEMLGKDGMNSYVWDFGVHPDAPPNLAVIRPEHKEHGKPGTPKPEEPKPKE